MNRFHHSNMQVLATEMCKVKCDLSHKIFSELFCQTHVNPDNPRTQHDFEVPFVKTVYHRSEIISYFGPKIWDILPASIKEANSLKSFKKLIKKMGPTNMPLQIAQELHTCRWFC